MHEKSDATHGLCLLIGGAVALVALVAGMFAGAIIMQHREEGVNRLRVEQTASFHVELQRLNSETNATIDKLADVLDQVIRDIEEGSGLKVTSVSLREGDTSSTLHLEEPPK